MRQNAPRRKLIRWKSPEIAPSTSIRRGGRRAGVARRFARAPRGGVLSLDLGDAGSDEPRRGAIVERCSDRSGVRVAAKNENGSSRSFGVSS